MYFIFNVQRYEEYLEWQKIISSDWGIRRRKVMVVVQNRTNCLTIFP